MGAGTDATFFFFFLSGEEDTTLSAWLMRDWTSSGRGLSKSLDPLGCFLELFKMCGRIVVWPMLDKFCSVH